MNLEEAWIDSEINNAKTRRRRTSRKLRTSSSNTSSSSIVPRSGSTNHQKEHQTRLSMDFSQLSTVDSFVVLTAPTPSSVRPLTPQQRQEV